MATERPLSSVESLGSETGAEGLGTRGVPLQLVKHHRAHAASAAYTSGFDEALVVTLDGVGDGLSGSLSLLRDGKLHELSLIAARDSLGIFYEHVTQLMNMRELEDEGKVMALAAYGFNRDDEENPLMSLFRVEGNGIRCRLGITSLRRFLARELAMVPSERFARMAQQVVETMTAELVRAALVATGSRRLVYAGGVASNIKANLVLSELEECEELFVFPHMGDGGLALGAALARAAPVRFELGDLRLGPSPSSEEVQGSLSSSGLRFEKTECVASEAAERIERGEIVFWYQGRMEFGPRALGGRSILARPDRVDVRDRLNLELKRRVWYQPFCPSILDEEAARLLEHGAIPNRYMTMAYRVRPEGRDRLAGVIGPDGTCRPQMVDASYGRYHDLLRALEERIGVGAVLNTSLNLHGEPMVASPDDAIRTFVRSGAEALILDDYVVTHPSGATS